MTGLEVAAKAAFDFHRKQMIPSPAWEWTETPVLIRDAWVSMVGTAINAYNDHELG